MNNLRPKHRFLYFLIILSIIVLLKSCSTEDNDRLESFNTFLEINNGTSWFITNNEVIYIRLNDDINKIVEEWIFMERKNCYEYEGDFFKDGTHEIVENTIDRFVINYSNSGYSESLTYTIKEDILKVVVIYTEEDGFEGKDIYYFNRSYIDMGLLEICT